MANEVNSFYFYVLYCADNTLYGGYTTDLAARLASHQSGKGAKYTRVSKRQPLKLIYAERWASKSLAMSAEYHFKRLTRSAKESYLSKEGVLNVAKSPFVLVNRMQETDLVIERFQQ